MSRPTGRPGGRPKGSYGQATTQSRIRILEMLAGAALKGLGTPDLVAVCQENGLTFRSAKGLLMRAKKERLIFGKGVYIGGKGQKLFRYFATQEQCDAYVFEGVPTAAERQARRSAQSMAREKARLAQMPPEERAARMAARNERVRANAWKKRGFDEPPPKRTVKMTPEQRAEMTRKRLESLVAGRKAKAEEKRRQKEAARLPGRKQVVRDDRVSVPVTVVRKPVLVGEPIITSDTRVTIAPIGIDYRYHVDPRTVQPVFSGRRIGVYLEETEVV